MHVEATSSIPGRCVLLAEDDDDLRDMLTEVIEHDGFEVVAVRDGVEALRFLAAHDEEWPALIISDVRMPGLGGLDLLERMRGDHRPPTILMTGFGDVETRAEASRLGVAFTFDKPFDIDDLRTAILHLVH